MTRSLTLPDAKRDHVSGSANGSIKLLEYGDYECPFYADAQPMVKEIQRRLGDDLLFSFRHFPLINIHPHSMTTNVAIAAQYASGICASRAIKTDAVAATAVRIACVIEGRLFSSQAQSFMPK